MTMIHKIMRRLHINDVYTTKATDGVFLHLRYTDLMPHWRQQYNTYNEKNIFKLRLHSKFVIPVAEWVC
jgi:hypothetical protein